MDWQAEAMLLTMDVTCSLLILVFAGTTIKVWMGSSYKTIIKISALMLSANALYLVGSWGMGNEMSAKPKVKLWNAIGATGGLGDLCFGCGNWLLAVFYLKMCKHMPEIIRSRE